MNQGPRERRTVSGRRLQDHLVREMANKFREFRALLIWTARTVHMAHHGPETKRWIDCHLNICRSTRKAIGSDGYL